MVIMAKRIQEIDFNSAQCHIGKSSSHKGMPTIRCVCGSKILVVPDLKAMDRAIENHVAQHKHTNDDLEKLSEFLTEQVLIVASQSRI